MAVPSDQIPVGEGLDLEGKPGASFFIDRRTLELIEEEGPDWKFEDARFIEEAIREPDAIFQGLARHDQQENLCYSVRPTVDPDDESNAALPRYGYVFLVFVETRFGYVVFDWEWREEDAENPGHPLNWEEDFERRTWHKT